MKIVISGGNGFLGKSIIPGLIKSGYEVNIISRTQSVDAINHPEVKLYIGNYDDPDILKTVLPNTDLFIHLAYSTVPENSTLNPVSDISSNVIPSLKLFKFCSEFKVKQFYFVSSGGVVYGNKSAFPIKETDKTNPVSSYGISKLMIENQLKLLENNYGIKTSIFRIANAYGLSQHNKKNQGVINIWMEQIMKGNTVRMMGDGSIIRDYIHTDDITSMFLKSIESGLSGVFNIGTGVGTSLNQIVEILERITKRKAQVEHLPFRKFDVEKNVLDISLIKSKINWQPEISLEQGIHNIFSDKFGN